ncbi:hypothetical protein LLG95_12945 [bacterium]|nr:hypothetical protein [bacterium]
MNIDQYIKLLDAVLRRTDLVNPAKLLFCQATLQPSIREGWFYGSYIDRLAEEFGLTAIQFITSCASLTAVDLLEIKYDLSGTVSIGLGLGAKIIAGTIPPPPNETGETQVNDTHRSHEAQRRRETAAGRDIPSAPTTTEFAEAIRKYLDSYKHVIEVVTKSHRTRTILLANLGTMMSLLRRHDAAIAADIKTEAVNP